jgi:hypothetical protein
VPAPSLWSGSTVAGTQRRCPNARSARAGGCRRWQCFGLEGKRPRPRCSRSWRDVRRIGRSALFRRWRLSYSLVTGERGSPCLRRIAVFVCAGPFADYGEGQDAPCPGSSSSFVRQASSSSGRRAEASRSVSISRGGSPRTLTPATLQGRTPKPMAVVALSDSPRRLVLGANQAHSETSGGCDAGLQCLGATPPGRGRGGEDLDGVPPLLSSLTRLSLVRAKLAGDDWDGRAGGAWTHPSRLPGCERGGVSAAPFLRA